jgi:hypothetical protein
MSVGVRFRETMQGQFIAHDGAAPASMVVHASVSAPSVRRLWLGEPMTLSGTVYIAHRLEATQTSGSIIVDLRDCRRIVYDLSWRDAEGRLGRFYGWKSLSITRLLRSWTELDGQVIEAGQLVGQARLRFDLSSLPQFLSSLRPG